MKRVVLVTLVAFAMASTASAQSSIFDRYDVQMTGWASLPSEAGWGGETSMVAADGNGNVAVIVRVAPHLWLLKTDGTYVTSWAEEGSFGMAHSVHFDGDGNIWASDPIDHAVYKFDMDGNLLMTLGERGVSGDNSSTDHFNQPNYVAFGSNGDVFVSDGYRNSRIVQFTADGEFVRIIGGVQGDAPGELNLPHGVAIDSDGRIFVSDSNNKRISIFDSDGEFVEIWNAPSRGGIAITSDDTVYVSDVNGGAVSILKDGRYVDVIRVEGRPHGLAVDPTTLDVYTSSSIRTSPNITKSVPK